MLQNNLDELENEHQQIMNELLAAEENWNLEEENFLDPVEADEREDGEVEIDLVDEADELDIIADQLEVIEQRINNGPAHDEEIIFNEVKSSTFHSRTFYFAKKRGPTEIWTRIAGFRVQSANRYTIRPLRASLIR